jgi:hypothetical protein
VTLLIGAGRGTYALATPGRRRKPDPPVVVTIVLDSGEETVLAAGSALTRAMGQVAALLAHW